MTRFPHEIPTHLGVEDKAFFGLALRPALYLLSGIAASYGLWTSETDLPASFRLGLAVACFAVGVTVAFIQPMGRGLDEWAIVSLRYLATPRRSVWRREIVDDPDAQPPEMGWAELTSATTWSDLRRSEPGLESEENR